MLPSLTSSSGDVIMDRHWSSSSLGRSWTSLNSESLSASFSLARKRLSKSKGDRLSSSLGNSEWSKYKEEKNASTLVEAVRKGRGRHVQLLLEAGTDPNVPDETGTTPLIVAIHLSPDQGCQDNVIKLLLKSGADPNIGDSRGITPLMYAARAERHDATVSLLHHAGSIDPGIQDHDGNSALMYAAAFGRTEIALLILSTFRKLHHLTFINTRNSQGLTATQLAEQNGHESLALLLKVENEFAPRPSGPSTFIPSAFDLDRPPTPTETTELGQESVVTVDSVKVKPSSQRDTLKVGPPSSDEQRVLDHLSRSLDLSSSPGSGNEADTESLMEGEKLTVEDLDNNSDSNTTTTTIMATSTAAPPSYSSSTSGVVQKDLPSGQVHQRRLSGSLGSVSNSNSSSIQLIDPGTLKKTSLSSSAAALLSTEGMPKIHTMHKNIKNLVQEEIELRPGQRPPTPARPSLPTLLPNRLQDMQPGNVRNDGLKSSNQIRRITLTTIPRSSSEPHQLPASPRVPSSDDETIDILESSVKSEGWDQIRGGRSSRCPSQMQFSDGHVVPLPPISKSKYFDITSLKSNRLNDGNGQREDSVINVAKKTLEKLDSVLSNENATSKLSKSKTHNQLHLAS